jgi:hypothetical protein
MIIDTKETLRIPVRGFKFVIRSAYILMIIVFLVKKLLRNANAEKCKVSAASV